jgi:diguanylate cyclase (GGDEF)-like protein
MRISDPLAVSLAEWAYKAAPTALAVTDRDGVIQTSNPSFAELCGQPVDVIGGLVVWETLGASTRTPLQAGYRDAMATGSNRSVVMVDGEAGRQHWDFHIDYDADTGLIRLLGQDRTQEYRLSAKVQQTAIRDRLTGLENRDAFIDELDKVVGSRLSVALYVIDVDRFALLNDTYGHTFGDSVLLVLSRRLTQMAGARNMVARIGGDQFAVMLRRLEDEVDVEAAAARLHNGLSGAMSIEGTTVHLRMSMGFTFSPKGAISAADLMRDADTALSRAADLGGNRFQQFHTSFQEQIEHRIRTEADLRQAIGTAQLDADVQGIYRPGDRKLVGFEGLARWRHPDRGTVPPDEFIDVADRFNLLDHVLSAVLDRSLASLLGWLNADRTRYLAVNVAPSQLRDPELLPTLVSALTQFQLSPDQLVVEVTERELVADADSIETVERLHALGLRVAIDDFGSGASSLGYLWTMPVSILKLDRSLTNSMMTDVGAQRVVTSLVNLAHDLDLDVVAEGVEEEHELQRLVDLDCGFAQGYLLHRPCPADTIEARLAQTNSSSAEQRT